MAEKILKQNSWAKVVKVVGVQPYPLGYYIVYTWSGLLGEWILGSDYMFSREKAIKLFKGYSDRTGFELKRIKH